MQGHVAALFVQISTGLTAKKTQIGGGYRCFLSRVRVYSPE